MKSEVFVEVNAWDGVSDSGVDSPLFRPINLTINWQNYFWSERGIDGVAAIAPGATRRQAIRALPIERAAQQSRTTRKAEAKLSEVADWIAETVFASRPSGALRAARSASLERIS